VPTAKSLKGVDDFLGAGGQLGDLETVDYYLPRATQVAISGLGIQHSTRQDQRIRNREVLSALAMFAGPVGEVPSSLGMIAKVMNRSRSAAIRQLEVWGALTVEGDLDARRDYWRGWLEWNEAPVIVLADEFRAAGHSARLSEVLKVDLTAKGR
jgi:hypothetical protein